MHLELDPDSILPPRSAARGSPATHAGTSKGVAAFRQESLLLCWRLHLREMSSGHFRELSSNCPPSHFPASPGRLHCRQIRARPRHPSHPQPRPLVRDDQLGRRLFSNRLDPGRRVKSGGEPSGWIWSSAPGKWARAISTGKAAGSFNFRFPTLPRPGAGSTVRAIPTGRRFFDRDVIPRCLECHATYFEVVSEKDPTQPYLSNVYNKDNYLLGVTCERCHGPGALHSANPQARSTSESSSAADIVHPGKIGRERQITLCAQCHSGHLVPREGPFSFRPGPGPRGFHRCGEPPGQAQRGSAHHQSA